MDRKPGGAGRVHDRNMAPGKGPRQQVNKKRLAKNSKFGFGGSKRLSKQNDAYSAASMDGYRAPGKPSFGGQGGKATVRGRGYLCP